MKVYHGAIQQVRKPIVEKGRPSTDFGKGFYTTTNFEQAKNWALIKQRNSREDTKAIVNIYEVDDELLKNTTFDVRTFNAPDEEWLNFVVGCRKGELHQHEIVFGPVANDKIYVTIAQYENHLLDLDATIARLKINEVYNQISFHSETALSELLFIEHLEV